MKAENEWGRLFFCGVVAIPWAETLLGQALPMVLFQALRRPAVPYLVLATVWFAGIHGLGVDQGGQAMILSRLGGALILSGTFLRGWDHSLWRGIWMATVVHTACNLSAFLHDLATGRGLAGYYLWLGSVALVALGRNRNDPGGA